MDQNERILERQFVMNDAEREIGLPLPAECFVCFF